jgi:ribose transport system substrate-binding protein
MPMALLNRDQNPVVFTVATSVASGLIVATILNAFRNGISTSAALIWFVLTALAVAAICVLVFFRARNRSRRVFLIMPAFSQKYFLATLVQQLHHSLDLKGIDLVLKVPDRDYDASAQSHHLNRILDRRRDYIGGIIVATDVDRLSKGLTKFLDKARLPVVFTDLEPFKEYPAKTAFVGYDTGKLGEQAGTRLAKYLRDKDQPHVLIIASREHSNRQERCEQALKTALPDMDIEIKDECDFDRSLAYDTVRDYVQQLDPRKCLDAIVCTNDEMALGAVDAVTSLSPAPVVVGVDGVLEAKALITTGSPLRATVVQDPHYLASTIVDTLEAMHRDQAVDKRTILSAKIFPPG